MTNKRAANSPKLRDLLLGVLVAAVVLVTVILVWTLRNPGTDDSPVAPPDNSLEGRLRTLKQAALEEAAQDGVTLFFSVSDGESRAWVFSGSAPGFQEAWELGEAQVLAHAEEEDPLWIRLDLVTAVTPTDPESLGTLLAGTQSGFFRQGVALDGDFATAFLEQELNANALLDYDGGGLDLEVVTRYLADEGRPGVDVLPDTLYLFDTQGWFSDEDGFLYRLHSDPLNRGRRQLEAVDDGVALGVVGSAADYLARQALEDGHFVYGYYAATAREIGSYNILRHCGTVWSLICQYRITGEEELVVIIQRTLECLASEYIEYADETTAYVVERKNGEIKLGGNALAVIAMTNYQEEFHDDRYQDLAVALGNGILTMMDPEDGTYYHVWEFPAFQPLEEFRTIYYDGEATFALARLHSLTGEAHWLDAAQAALDNFIREDYTQYRDHWVSYAINEVTKYAPREEYFTLGLRNAGENLQRIRDRETTYHTYMELLMCTFELYNRMLAEGYTVEYLEEFDAGEFLDTIFYRADYMLNGYGYPEQVMYFYDPQLALGSFFIRQDRFRMRIDDVQHFVGGYYSFYVNYARLQEHLAQLS